MMDLALAFLKIAATAAVCVGIAWVGCAAGIVRWLQNNDLIDYGVDEQ